jgi:hypothetical protein
VLFMMMQYLSELVHAQLMNEIPGSIPDGIHIEELEEIAHRNHMDYLILGALLKTKLSDEKKTRIKPFVMQSTMKSMAQLCCIKELEDRFEKEGIYNLLLKGAVLKRMYPSPEMREMSDIDVMVYDKNLDRAKKVVEEMGYTLYDSINHHDIYIKPPMLVIELHHTLYGKDVDKVQYEYFNNKKPLVVKEGKKYTLQFSAEDFYVYLIAHMAKHFFETGCGIRNIVDVYYYQKLYAATWDKAMIASELEKCGLSSFEKHISDLAQVWLGGQTSDSFSGMLFNYMLDCGIYGKSENGLWGYFAMMNNSDVNNFQSHAKRWYYFPPLSYLVRDYPWLKKFPFLLIIAWGIRAVHGLLSKEGREKRNMLLSLNNKDVRIINELYKGMQLNFKND